MAWAAWLAGPVVATLLAALWVWWRARPAPTPSARQAVRAHREYLDALARPTRGRPRTDQQDD